MVIGLNPVRPVGIQPYTNVPCPAQVINGQEYLIPRDARTKVHDLFQWALCTQLFQCCLDSITQDRHDHRSPQITSASSLL
ncbi:MAG: hypothetical protein OJF50_002638 [Nitrospira sp.]|nr:hypothetical protein [Nitrospira sp.]